MKEMRERDVSSFFLIYLFFFFFGGVGRGVNAERGNAFKLRSLNSLAGGSYLSFTRKDACGFVILLPKQYHHICNFFLSTLSLCSLAALPQPSPAAAAKGCCCPALLAAAAGAARSTPARSPLGGFELSPVGVQR